MKNNIYPLVALASFAFADMTNAAPITWGQPQTIADALSDVETDGDLVFAIDAGGKGGTLTGKNGLDVIFTGLQAQKGGTSTGNFATRFSDQSKSKGLFGGAKNDYAAIIDLGFFAGLAVQGGLDEYQNHADSVTLTNLTVGQKYLVQYWVQDSQRHPGFSTVLDDQAKLLLDTDKRGDTNYGQFVVGTFTADATTQNISVRGYIHNELNNGRAQLNAIQLRALK